MSLALATVPLAGAPFLPPGPPFGARHLADWKGLEFDLPPLDPRLRHIHAGKLEPAPALANLVGYRAGWQDFPEYLDTLDPESPVFAKKRLERDLTLHHWRTLGGLAPNGRVLDIGCGVGRFATWFLDRGDSVILVDGDLQSLRRAVWHSVGRPGQIDAVWSTAEWLPDGRFGTAVMAEILNYVEDAERVVAEVRRRLVPGGVVLFSVEARYGWALATDVAAGLLPAWFEGPARRAGDRHVRLFERSDLDRLFAGATVTTVASHYTLSGPFEMAAAADLATGSLDTLLQLEAALAAHPVSAPLNRAWVGVARWD